MTLGPEDLIPPNDKLGWWVWSPPINLQDYAFDASADLNPPALSSSQILGTSPSATATAGALVPNVSTLAAINFSGLQFTGNMAMNPPTFTQSGSVLPTTTSTTGDLYSPTIIVGTDPINLTAPISVSTSDTLAPTFTVGQALSASGSVMNADTASLMPPGVAINYPTTVPILSADNAPLLPPTVKVDQANSASGVLMAADTATVLPPTTVVNQTNNTAPIMQADTASILTPTLLTYNPVTFDACYKATPDFATGWGPITKTWSHTIAADANYLLVPFFGRYWPDGYQCASAYMTVKCGTTNMTYLGGTVNGANYYQNMWFGLLNPPTGTQTISMGWTSTLDYEGCLMSLSYKNVGSVIGYAGGGAATSSVMGCTNTNSAIGDTVVTGNFTSYTGATYTSAEATIRGTANSQYCSAVADTTATNTNNTTVTFSKAGQSMDYLSTTITLKHP